MGHYNRKILKLEEIKNIDGEYYLDIIFSYQSDMNLLWKVDSFTAENIKKIMALDEKHNYKYRLSLSLPTESAKNEDGSKHYFCLMTRTFRDKSEQFSFACSKDYAGNLIKLKTCQAINELDEQVFIFPNKKSTARPSFSAREFMSRLTKGLKKSYITKTASVLFVMLLITSFYFIKVCTAKDHSSAASVLAAAAIVDGRSSTLIEKKSTRLLENETLLLGHTLPTDNGEVVEAEEIADEPETENETETQTETPAPAAIFQLAKEEKNFTLPPGKVALTFDDGPSAYSKSIVDILDQYEVGGTFFVVGREINKFPGVLEYVHGAGYSIGNHSMHHINMAKSSQDQRQKDFSAAKKLIEETIGEKVDLYRPPYGSTNSQVEQLVYDNDGKVVLWSNDPKDWKAQSPGQIIHHIKNTDTSGKIILLHENRHLVKALPQIIEHLQSLDLEIVNLE